MHTFIKNLISVLFPHKCTFCREPIDYTNDTFICPDCMRSLPFIQGARCLRCGTPIGENALPVCNRCRKYKYTFSAAFTPLIYKDSVRRSIINMKFHNKDHFCRSYAFLITDSIIRNGFPDFDFITYVPLSEERYKERNFNQAQLIAEKCAQILNLPVISALERLDGTPRQATLSFSERRKNVRKSYKCKNIKLKGTALLIDDVYTTGSTMDYCASLLLKMGCEKVCIAAVALKEK